MLHNNIMNWFICLVHIILYFLIFLIENKWTFYAEFCIKFSQLKLTKYKRLSIIIMMYQQTRAKCKT